MAFDLTSIDFRSGLHGVIFDDTAADATGSNEPIIAWDSTAQRIFIHLIELGCACGFLTLFDGSAGSKIAGLRCITGAGFVTATWDFRSDPIRTDGTTNICVSAAGVVHGTVKYELGS